MPIVTEKSRKWFLAIIMTVLIVGMALPSYFGRNDHGRHDTKVGTIFGEPLLDSEIQNAKEEWQRLNAVTFTVPSLNASIPIAARLFLPSDQQLSDQFTQMIAGRLLNEFNKNPALYAILKREAARAGIRPSRDQVEGMLVNELQIPIGTRPEIENDWRTICTNFLAVRAYAWQVGSAIKLSKPEVQSELAQRLQTLTLTVVTFDAEEFRPKVPAPSDDDVRKLYDSFKDRTAGVADPTTDPYGFGYRQESAVQLDYLAVTKAELSRAARASKKEDRWEIDANKYYLQNKSLYVVEKPTTAPTTGPSLSLGNITPPTTPVQQSFAEVKDAIVGQLVDDQARTLGGQVTRRLTQLLSSDYRLYTDALLKQKPAPASSVGAPVITFDYLRAVAAKIQQETGVLPEIVTFGDRYFDQAALNLEDFGRALSEGAPGRQAALGSYVLSRAKVLFDATNTAQRDPSARALENFEPTPIFSSEQRPVVVARITNARLAAATPFEQVKDRVRGDFILQAATQLARAEAEKFIADAKTTPLTQAAAGASRRFIPVPALMADPSSLPPELFALAQTSREAFVRAAFDLLRVDPAQGSPRGVVTMPRDRRVAAIELTDAKPLTPGIDIARIELRAAYDESAGILSLFYNAFFDPAAIIERTAYIDLTPKRNAPATQP